MMLDANSLKTNLLVTFLVAFLVIVMPWADRRICRRLGVNLHGGLNSNPHADRLLKIRQGILITGLALYLFIYFWLTFLSRSTSYAVMVHLAPLEDL